MDLVLIRHAIAEDREIFAETGEADSERPLTDRGRRRMREGARGLRSEVPSLDVLATSPYVRAADTGRIIADSYREVVPVVTRALEPDAGFPSFVAWLRTLGGPPTVAAVGHEPHLSRLASWLLGSEDHVMIELRKGGACLLAFEGALGKGHAVLRWSLAPGQLRRLGR